MDLVTIITKIVPEGIFRRKLRRLFFKHQYRLYRLKLARPYYSAKYYKVKRGDVIVDAGAHIGLTVIMAAKAAGNEGMVIAIEPNENNMHALKRNATREGLKNVVIVPKAIWSEKGTMRLYLHDCSDGHSVVNKQPKENGTVESVEVKADTLDNILAEMKVSKVDFIKMNIEGAEIEALKGSWQTLRNNDVKLVIAANHKINGEPCYKTVMPWLTRAQFEVFEEEGVVYAQKTRG